MFRIVLLVIAAIILYKLIFDFVIPIYRTSKQIKRKFRDMHQQMGGQANGFDTHHQQQPSKKPSQKDYIDFEEIK